MHNFSQLTSLCNWQKVCRIYWNLLGINITSLSYSAHCMSPGHHGSHVILVQKLFPMSQWILLHVNADDNMHWHADLRDQENRIVHKHATRASDPIDTTASLTVFSSRHKIVFWCSEGATVSPSPPMCVTVRNLAVAGGGQQLTVQMWPSCCPTIQS